MSRLRGLVAILTIVLGGVAIATVMGTIATARVIAASCAAEVEPDDQPDTAVTLSGAGCLDGSLPDGDGQDTWIWVVSADDARHPWTITLTGIPETATGVELVPITSEPGVTPIAWTGQALITVTAQPDHATASAVDQLIPAGRYVLGVGRTASISGAVPSTYDYRIDIAPGDPLPASADMEPNDDIAHAVRVKGAVTVSGDSADTVDEFAWKLDADAADHTWDVVLQAGLGTTGQVQLLDRSGGFLTSAGVDTTGIARLYDLRLPAGTYVLNVIGDGHPGPQPYVLSTVVSDVARSDPEPDDDPSKAAVATVGSVVTGRLARAGDVDQFLLSLDGSQSRDLIDARLIWRDGPDRRLCISSVDSAGSASQLQCSTPPQHQAGGSGGGSTLDGLYLRQGDYLLTVTGESDPSSTYVLRVDTTAPPAPDFETEPDDTAVTAVPMSPTVVMHGRATAGDPDIYRVRVTGDAQVWTVHVTGTELDGLTWIDPLQAILSTGDVSTDRSEAILADVYLPPGDHLFEVTSDGGDYTLWLTPQGPPDANAELEPDDDGTHAVVMQVDTPMLGRLPQRTDVDVYRFSLAAADHLRLSLAVPPDGAIDASLMFEDRALASDQGAGTGVSWVDDLRLQPGDYELWLRPATPSASPYQVLLTREDPFAVRQDQEPDDTLAQARPMPPSLHVSGTRDEATDQDWYQLGTMDQPTTITVALTGAVSLLGISDGRSELPVTEDAPTQTYTIGPTPTGVPLYLHLIPGGDYTLAVSGIPKPDGPPIPAPALSARLGLSLSDPEVAAYWDAGQELSGNLTITSTGSTTERLALDATTSHFAWTVTLGQDELSLAPGSTVTVPVTVDILPDAWADVPVRLTVRASDPTGAQATTSMDVTPGRTASPASPRLAWSVPAALLGGLDVAATSLGGTPVPSVDPVAETHLYDGIEHTQGAFTATLGDQPIALTTQLAGDAPVPVRGILIDPLAPIGQGDTAPRAFTLSVSNDGATYHDVLSGEVSPLPMDQSFVLPEPVAARFARLTIETTWGDAGVPFAISEWKVVAQPGVSPLAGPLDIADPGLGGHVVWADPMFASQADAQRMLDADTSAAQVVFAPRGARPTWVIGFKDDRAGRLSGLEWVDPSGSNPRDREKRVSVEVSTQGPLGPWQDMGTWTLTRASDGSVLPFRFGTPTWARFIRFTGSPIATDGAGWEVPAVVRAMEEPTSEHDRSILGEWGQDATSGPYEWSQPPSLVPVADTGEPNDTPETATPLAPGTPVTGYVHRSTDVDWYTLTTGAGQDDLTLSVSGDPTSGVRLTLYDDAGTVVQSVFGDGEAPGTGTYRAKVRPSATYRVKVEQPTFDAVFAFDSSGSMTPYLPIIEQVERAYVADRRQDDVPPQVITFRDDRTQATLVAASDDLAGHDGARAVLLITDWEVAGYPDTQTMWRALSRVRPIIFGTFVGDLTPHEGDDAMRDITLAGRGTSGYGGWHGEGDRAFDRMATWLRRPAEYSLSWVASSEPAPPAKPATLTVVSPPAEDGSPGRPTIAKDVSVEIILDTSGSMLTPFGRTRRIDVAKSVLSELVDRDLRPGTPVAVRVFGDPAHPCATSLAVPYGPLVPDAVTTAISGIEVFGRNDTPVGKALRNVPADLSDSSGTRIVLLITDSQETWPNRDLCGLDPRVAVRELARSGTVVDVIGMSVTDAKARRTMRSWTRIAHGQYFDADDPGQLSTAVASAITAPYDVFDTTGARVGGGVVGGPAIVLPPGSYRVVVSADPEVTFATVVLESGGSVTLTMPSAPGAPAAGQP